MKTIPRPYLIGGAVLLVLLIVGGIVLARRRAGGIVDSCGNTAASASAANVFESCATVSGTVVNVINDPNGTLEVELAPDRGSSSAAVNEQNVSNQGGNLLVVLTCTDPVNLSDSYFNSCARFRQTDILPGIDQHLSYTGTIRTNPRFGWNEMYPTSEN